MRSSISEYFLLTLCLFISSQIPIHNFKYLILCQTNAIFLHGVLYGNKAYNESISIGFHFRKSKMIIFLKWSSQLQSFS